MLIIDIDIVFSFVCLSLLGLYCCCLCAFNITTDIALDLLKKFPSMTISKDMLKKDYIITLLENMLTAFPTASRRQQLIYES